MSAGQLLTVGEVADELRVNDVTVRRWIKREELSAINLGGVRRPDYRIRRTDLDAFIATRAEPVRRFGYFFDLWCKNDDRRTREQLVEKLGMNRDRMLSLEAEPVPIGMVAMFMNGVGPSLPPRPLPWQLQTIAEKYGIAAEPLINVLKG